MTQESIQAAVAGLTAISIGTVVYTVILLWNKEPEKRQPITEWEKHSLIIIYICGWLWCWGNHLYGEWAQEHWAHAEIPYWLAWYTTSFENLASEWFQIGSFILLAKFFKFFESPESRDSQDKHEHISTDTNERVSVMGGRDGNPIITEMQDGTCKVELVLPGRRRYVVDLAVQGQDAVRVVESNRMELRSSIPNGE